ncbi:MAG TPA: DMT family transporter [Streptosporangiaceae bacterium]|nr:DMT family transporter [Streptosporangiaceae bacterium]
MRVTAMPPAAAAAAGAVCISSSAVLMRLAGTSPSLTALGRCVFALPVLGALAWLERRRGTPPMPSRRRWLARLAGVILAADLIVWDHAIGAIGAGLGTVVGNLEVLIISLLAWLVLGERPRRSLILASPVMLAGLVLVAGLADGPGARAYGADPGVGVVYGIGVALLYAIYILMLRQATSSPGSSSGSAPGSAGSSAGRSAVAAPLFDATVGAAAGSLVLGLALSDFGFGPSGGFGTGPSVWPALGWLALLALTSQVIGWLLITVSMPRLAAGMIGALLLIQPAGSVALSYLLLNERPSTLQLTGVALMLAGVVIAVSGGAPAVPYSRRRTRIIRQAPAASSGRSAPKSP